MKFLFLLLIRFYRYTLSAVFGRTCRHLPTCSEYMEEAVERHGVWAGFWMGVARFCRCHPFGSSGFDPVPSSLPVNACWYRPWRYGQWTGRHITLRCGCDDVKE